ncbi:hypothetical protein GE061_007276 [Apolygus lucorum]|uniref:Uncharacterized protein n=1 Tax=Apolygus lucorum TaxID=248454 RepID=A0A8S9WT11_APOLU|nr:hypothetical protein GE061_007276 [Apolygus lucorum]
MIGAMPAVAVRHERRRQEKRNKRPSLLYLQSPHSRSATPSPLQSPPASHQFPPEIYVCGKVSVLHIVVVSLLLGAVLLIVGLVQLKPGADASQHRYMLLGSGAFLVVVGIALAVVRCCLLPWKGRPEPGVHIPEAPNPGAAPTPGTANTPGREGSRRDSLSAKRNSTKRGSSVEFDSLPPPAKVHETCETRTS